MKTFNTMLKTELKLSLRGMDMFMELFTETSLLSRVQNIPFWSSLLAHLPQFPSVRVALWDCRWLYRNTAAEKY